MGPGWPLACCSGLAGNNRATPAPPAHPKLWSIPITFKGLCDPCYLLFPRVVVPPSSLQRSELVRPSWPLHPMSSCCPSSPLLPQALFSLWCHPCFLSFNFFLLCLFTTVLSHLEHWCWVTSACHFWAAYQLALPPLTRAPQGFTTVFSCLWLMDIWSVPACW